MPHPFELALQWFQDKSGFYPDQVGRWMQLRQRHESTAASMDVAPVAVSLDSTVNVIVIVRVLFGVAMVLVLTYSFGWLFWLVLSILLTVVQLLYAMYQLSRIGLDLLIVSALKFYHLVWSLVTGRLLFRGNKKNNPARRRSDNLSRSRSLQSFERLVSLDEEANRHTAEWREVQ
jgi:hypothetical protein